MDYFIFYLKTLLHRAIPKRQWRQKVAKYLGIDRMILLKDVDFYVPKEVLDSIKALEYQILREFYKAYLNPTPLHIIKANHISFNPPPH